MGVLNLWSIFDGNEISTAKNISDLQGKRVAVDLSGWVVQAQKTVGLNKSKKPYLKILLYRTKALLVGGVLPIFVMEGQAPACKREAIRKRLNNGNPYDDSEISRNSFDVLLRECEQLLKLLGVPCIRGSGEAESFCAFLNYEGLVDGCITEDSDAFLYGAKTVFKDFTISTTKHAKDGNDSSEVTQLKAYTIGDIEKKLKLDRKKLIALSLLLGCDYYKGVRKVGKETALKLLKELKDCDVLQRFRDWKTSSESDLFPSVDLKLGTKMSHCKRCGHPGRQKQHIASGCSKCNSKNSCDLPKDGESCSCEWHVNTAAKERIKTELKVYNIVKKIDSFPCEKVITEYLNQNHNLPPQDVLKWTAPDIVDLQNRAYDWFSWTYEHSLHTLMPIYVSWMLMQKCKDLSKANEDYMFTPEKIEKIQQSSHIKYYKVLWTKNATVPDTCCPDKPSTLVDMEDFKKAYPDIVNNFEEEKQKEKDLKEEKKNAKKASKRKAVSKKKPEESNSTSDRKIKEFFKPISSSMRNEISSTSDASEDGEPLLKRRYSPENN